MENFGYYSSNTDADTSGSSKLGYIDYLPLQKANIQFEIHKLKCISIQIHIFYTFTALFLVTRYNHNS